MKSATGFRAGGTFVPTQYNSRPFQLPGGVGANRYDRESGAMIDLGIIGFKIPSGVAVLEWLLWHPGLAENGLPRLYHRGAHRLRPGVLQYRSGYGCRAMTAITKPIDGEHVPSVGAR
jgi:hypothetical protein